MGLVAIDVNHRVEFSLKEDQGGDRTIFYLRPLDAMERSFVSSLMAPVTSISKPPAADEKATAEDETEDASALEVKMSGTTMLSMMSGSVWALRLALVGWLNFLTEDGKEVPCERKDAQVPGVGIRQALSEEFVLRHFASAWVGEISGEVFRLSRLTKRQRKN